MRILILTGGSGSVAIQHGIFGVFERQAGVGSSTSSPEQQFKVQVLTNAYDDGLSTGLVRRAAKGALLGPSDVRKNQVLRYEMLSQRFPETYPQELHKFLSYRFTVPTSEAQDHCLAKIAELVEEVKDEHIASTFSDAVVAYFKLPLASTFDYIDFSIANIIYAGIALQHGGSLRAAASQMAHILKIAEDFVILNEDRSLFLSAVTQSGHVIKDECNIDVWGNSEDPLEKITFTDAAGKSSQPVLCAEAQNAIASADLIILSTGTQWTSLIPTYMSEGFSEAIENSKAKVVMVMNRAPDADAPYETAQDILDRIRPFFGAKKINVLCDANGADTLRAFMIKETPLVEADEFILSNKNEKHHDPRRVALGIACSYFGTDALFSPLHVFDYDDTLVARGSAADAVGVANIEAISSMNEREGRYDGGPYNVICTGNSISVLQRFCNMYARPSDNRLKSQRSINLWSVGVIPVFFDGGINFTNMSFNGEDRMNPVVLDEVYAIVDVTLQDPKQIIDRLMEQGIPGYKIEVRNEVMVCIRPVDQEYRKIVSEYIELKLKDLLDAQGLTCKLAGRSTIEIHDKRISKVLAIEELLEDVNSQTKYRYVDIDEQMIKAASEKSEFLITYVGDEFEPGGNDHPVKEKFGSSGQVCFVEVTSTAMTLMYLMTVKNLKFSALGADFFPN